MNNQLQNINKFNNDEYSLEYRINLHIDNKNDYSEFEITNFCLKL